MAALASANLRLPTHPQLAGWFREFSDLLGELRRFGRWFVAQVGPGPKRAARAPALFTPAAALVKGDFDLRFEAMQTDLLRLLEAADGLDLRRIKVRLQQAHRLLADPYFPPQAVS